MTDRRQDRGEVRQPRRRRRTTDPHVVLRIQELAAEGKTTGQIEQQLAVELLPAPPYRTISDIAREARAVAGEPWSFADGGMPPEDAAVVLDALEALLNLSQWEARTLTKDEARWVVRLSRARPARPGQKGLPAHEALRLSRLYIRREQDGLPSHDLDRALAWRVWEEPDRRLKHYFEEHGGPDDDQA